MCWEQLTPVLPGAVCSAVHAWVKGLREMHVYPEGGQKWQTAVADSKDTSSCEAEFFVSFSYCSFHNTLLREL